MKASLGDRDQYSRGERGAAVDRYLIRHQTGSRVCAKHSEDRRHCCRCPLEVAAYAWTCLALLAG